MAPELRPRRSKPAAAAEAAAVEQTPKSKPKTPKTSKRKATEDVSPAATKKQKAVKTPSKPKDTEEPASKEAEPTPMAKKAKTPVKAKETKEAASEQAEQAERTPASKAKKDKTPAKAKDTEENGVKAVEKTPASKLKNNTPAKAKDVQEQAAETVQSTPATKSKKEKTPAKVKLAKETPSKGAEKSTPKSASKSAAEAKETPKTISKNNEQTPASDKTSTKTPKSAKKSGKKTEKEPVEEKKDTVKEAGKEIAAPIEDEQSSDEEADEQTRALVQTIDSGDEDGPGSGVVLFEQGQDVGKIPEMSKKERKKAQKALAASKDKEETGVIYVGRLPHGFYEHEMKSYFSQFGPIRNLRVSRNKKTGHAKHFAFIEFEELSTAEIVAKTMDNYLLFGHILKCSVIPKAQVHEELFKGANKRFKPVPWNKMEGKQMERPILEDKWARKVNKEKKRRADRAKKLEAMGYEFSAPELMDVDAVQAITTKPGAIEEGRAEAVEEAATKAIEAPPVAEAAEDEAADKEQEATPKPVKRGRGRPAKTPQKVIKGAETPRKARKAKV